MLGYHASIADQAELRTWLLNEGCFAQGPDFLEKHVIFINRQKLIEALKKYKSGHYKEQEAHPDVVKGALDTKGSYQSFESWMALQMLAGPIGQAICAIECYEQERYDTFKPRPMDRKNKEPSDHYINELDLRKILS